MWGGRYIDIAPKLRSRAKLLLSELRTTLIHSQSYFASNKGGILPVSEANEAPAVHWKAWPLSNACRHGVSLLKLKPYIAAPEVRTEVSRLRDQQKDCPSCVIRLDISTCTLCASVLALNDPAFVHFDNRSTIIRYGFITINAHKVRKWWNQRRLYAFRIPIVLSWYCHWRTTTIKAWKKYIAMIHWKWHCHQLRSKIRALGWNFDV